MSVAWKKIVIMISIVKKIIACLRCSFSRYTVLRTSLEITNLEISDSGKYQCFAENDAGSIWGNVTLKVIKNEG